MRAADEVAVAEAGSTWWIFLITGFLWLIFSFVVMSFDFTTITAIAVFGGVAFMAAGFNEFFIAFMVPGWRWLRIIMGFIGIAAGATAFAWPGKTFLVFAGIFAWYLLFRGTFDLVFGLMDRTVEFWWLRLIVGVAEMLTAFWAIGYPGNAITLLIVWVGASALFRGMGEIILAFELRSLRVETV